MNFTDEQIKKIAEEVDAGFCCYYHQKTGDLIFIPDEMQFAGGDFEAWEEEKKKLRRDRENYIEISRPSSRDSFKIMEDFADQLDENPALQDELFKVLSRKSPFANFKAVINDSGEYRQKWFDFKEARMIDWVRKQIV